MRNSRKPEKRSTGRKKTKRERLTSLLSEALRYTAIRYRLRVTCPLLSFT